MEEIAIVYATCHWLNNKCSISDYAKRYCLSLRQDGRIQAMFMTRKILQTIYQREPLQKDYGDIFIIAIIII